MWRLVGFGCVVIVLGLSVNVHADHNLVPNGSFEQGRPVAARFPAEWEIEKGHPACFRLTSDRPFDGQHSLELTTADEPATLVATEVIPVEPGATYRLRHHFRIEKSNLAGGQAVYVQGRYLDAEGQILDWREHGSVTLNTGGRTRPSLD